jgi:hypothetical protein
MIAKTPEPVSYDLPVEDVRISVGLQGQRPPVVVVGNETPEMIGPRRSMVMPRLRQEFPTIFAHNGIKSLEGRS